MMNVNQLLKYVDLFGKKCSFFVEKTPKLYSVANDFRRIFPAVSISSVQPNDYHKIKFGKEKIWIPWRIRDYSNHFVNRTNIFYPLIYNYYSIKNHLEQDLNLK